MTVFDADQEKVTRGADLGSNWGLLTRLQPRLRQNSRVCCFASPPMRVGGPVEIEKSLPVLWLAGI
ncbi:hypothetical protein NBRC116601_04130 [Cognatishimia sp. WU-CL00825]|uniref:hypothetical protein n=1 Tax=Cognatishimia sp. WU-CL00825 TaxID=3127658 RepID=UPI00310C1FBD